MIRSSCKKCVSFQWSMLEKIEVGNSPLVVVVTGNEIPDCRLKAIDDCSTTVPCCVYISPTLDGLLKAHRVVGISIAHALKSISHSEDCPLNGGSRGVEA